MLVYSYTARDPATGKRVKAEVEADSEQTAARLIKQEGLSPLDIAVKDPAAGRLRKFTNRTKTSDKVIFSRQLSTLIDAGLPIVQALRTVADQTKNKPMQMVISKVIADVEAGSTLSASMSKYPAVFNQVYTSMVAAGETSGTLDVSLERLANQQEKDAELVGKVRGAMIYPVIVILVMIGVVSFMLIKVLPQVQVLYDGIKGAELPAITQVLLAASNFLVKFWWLILILAGSGLAATVKWYKTKGGRSFFDKLKMRAPAVGQLFTKLYMARFARTGTTLVGSGVPLIQTLEITARSVDNVHVEAAILQAAEKVKGGKTLSMALHGNPNFLELVPQMLKIGEDSGAIEQMMAKTADYYEKEVDQQIRTVSSIIEPVMMVILGVVALIVIAAVLLPVYNLAGQNGFGA